MQGMFILYKLMGEENRKRIFGKDTDPSSEMGKINTAIELYKEKYPDFEEKFSKAKEGGLPKVFQQYKDKMQELIDTTKGNPKQQEQYKKYLDRVTTAEEFSFNSFQQMAKKLKHRMPLGPDAIDLLHNMEKLTSKTSIASENGTVLLKHMRVDNPAKNRVKWRMQIAEDGTLKLDCSASPKRTKELQIILFEYMNQARDQIKKEREALRISAGELSNETLLAQAKKLAEKDERLANLKVKIGTSLTGRIRIKCDKEYLEELCDIFKEDRIKQLKPKVALTLDVTPDSVKEKLPPYEGLHSSPAVSESKTIKKPHGWRLTTASLFTLFKIKRKVDTEIKQMETPATSPSEKTGPAVSNPFKDEKTNDSSFAQSSIPGRRGSGHAA